MRFCFIKRPTISTAKLGRFLIGASLAFSASALSDESNFFATPSAEVRFAARPSADLVFSYPALGMASLLAVYQPLPELTVNVSAFGRVPVQSGPVHVDAFVALDDSYIKLKQPSFTFSLGYLRTPWIVLRGSAVNDRINPVDYRRGLDFAKDGAGRLPEWGLQLTGRVHGVSLEGIYHFWHRLNPASYVAALQDGVQIGHYQGALAGTPQELATLVPLPIVERELPWFSEPTIALAARKEFGDVQTGLNFVWGFSEVPMLSTSTTTQTIVALQRRALSLGAEVAASLGVVILKAEAVVTPKLDDSTGKMTVIGSGATLNTQVLTGATAAVGVEGEYGDSLSASLELLETAWFNVPPLGYVYAVENADAASSDYRFAQRLALAFVLDGKLFDSFLAWSLRGEFGLMRPDLLSTVNLRHDFADTGFSIGAYANLFFGVDGSPGALRKSATECGLSFVYRL
jgi:hypothetical protein